MCVLLQDDIRDVSVEMLRDRYQLLEPYVALKLYCIRQQNGSTAGGIELDFFGPLKDGIFKIQELKVLAKNDQDMAIVAELEAMLRKQLSASEQQEWASIQSKASKKVAVI